jgi:uncharacterized RDD family membrane protein YckC
MHISFFCKCGESLNVPQSLSGRKAFCLQCRRPVPIPAAVVRAHGKDLAGLSDVTEGTTGVVPLSVIKSIRAEIQRDSSDGVASALAAKSEALRLKESIKSGLKNKDEGTVDVDVPIHAELIRNESGKEHWKLTCVCGKRLLSPIPSEQPYGRCPKCGRRMPLPGYDVPKVTRVAAQHQPSKRADGDEIREDRTTTFAAVAKPKKVDSNANFQAAVTAADRLRPQRPSVRSSAARTHSGRISAWPAAGIPRRLIATFIDLTLATTVAGLAMVLSLQGALPEHFEPIPTLAATMLLTLCFNDGVIHLIWGGSIGKLLVVIIVQRTEGGECSILRTLARALMKWLLLPGWIIGAIDAQERTLHDLLCDTTVLKGRSRM